MRKTVAITREIVIRDRCVFMRRILLLCVLLVQCFSKHVVLIDAGSSGSRVHIYEYKTAIGSPLQLKQLSSLKFRPGLDAFAHQPAEARLGLRDLLNYAKKYIPESDWAETPVSLKATAGLRLLDDAVVQELLEQSRFELDSHGFMFRSEWVELMSGSDEGFFGWLALNYLSGSFDGDARPAGLIELGGASLQIVVPLPSTIVSSSLPHEIIVQRPMPSKVIGVDHRVQLMSVSLLNYGLEQAQIRLHQLSSTQPEHCYASNTQLTASISRIPQKFTGNFSRCIEQCKVVLDDLSHPHLDSINRVIQHHLSEHEGSPQNQQHSWPMFAIENIFYTAEFFGANGSITSSNGYEFLQSKDEAATFQTVNFAAYGTDFCSRDYDAHLLSHPNEPRHDLEKYCFSTSYIHQLSQNLGVATAPVRIARRINVCSPTFIVHSLSKLSQNTPIDWSVGACIVLIDELMQQQQQTIASNPIPFLVAVAIGIVAVLLISASRNRRSSSVAPAKYRSD